MIEAYPLYWPENWPRTELHQRRSSQFQVPLGIASTNLRHEVNRLGGLNMILSSNIPVRADGLPYSKFRVPDDAGVAVYFELNGDQRCIPCDRWESVRENIRAIGLTVAALRGLDRWGAKKMVDAAFKGFAALPPPRKHWSEILGISADSAPAVIKAVYKAKALAAHPDQGGSTAEFQELKEAYEEALK